jgi:hypothetical protein
MATRYTGGWPNPVDENSRKNVVIGGSWILPCLGILLLPFTTLMYAILVTNGLGVTGTISGIDWLWIVLAVVVDLATIGAAGAANRNQIPQGYPGSLPPQAS